MLLSLKIFASLTLLLFFALPVLAGSVTLTTYYPAPTGNYTTLNVNNLGVGTSTVAAGVTLDVGSTVNNNAILRVKGPTSATTAQISVNTPIAADTVFVGATSNHPLILGNNNTERMRLTTAGHLELPAAGNIGLGATAPTFKIHAISNSNGIRLEGNLGVTNALILWASGNANNNRSVGFSYSANAASGQFTGNILDNGGGTPIPFLAVNRAGTATVNSVNFPNGNVGVGLATAATLPAEKLEVNGTVRASAFTQSAVSNNTFTGVSRFNNNVGINNAAPNYLLEVSGDIGTSAQFHLATNKYFGQFDANTVGIFNNLTWGLKVEDDGDVVIEKDIYADAFFYNSDKNLKDNIAPLDNPLNKLLALNGVSFKWKKDGKKSIGFIAQDVEKVFPELVNTNEKGIKSVEYGKLIAVLIEGVKAQQAEINELRNQIEELKKK